MRLPPTSGQLCGVLLSVTVGLLYGCLLVQLPLPWLVVGLLVPVALLFCWLVYLVRPAASNDSE